jgi:hypothetical protein
VTYARDGGADRRETTGQEDAVPEEAAEPDRRLLVLRQAHPADDSPAADDAEGLLAGGQAADRIHDHMVP